MANFVLRNNLHLMAALGVAIASYVALNWSSMPVLQRMVGLFFVGLSPGLATAIVLLLPISICAFAYVIRHDLMQPISWLFAFLYILFGLVVAQQIVIRTSGVKYSEFLKNVRMAPFERR